MISWISKWAQGIIIAVIIATIIEMILPNGTSKKYIKVVIGIYILFTIISPILENFSNNININEIIDTSKYTEILEEENEKISQKIKSSNSKTVKDIYIENLEKDITNKLKVKNYKVVNISIKATDNDNYTLKQIDIYIEKISEEKNLINKKQQDIKINEVKINKEISIDENVNQIDDEEKIEIKEYIAITYNVNENIINIS